MGLDILWQKVKKVLNLDEFFSQRSNYDRRSLIQKANNLGGPSMYLIHWKNLLKLKRLPRFDENEALEAVAGINHYGAPIVEIFMVSHRWLRPSLDISKAHPDNPSNDKAKAINEFSMWRQEWVKMAHGFRPEIFYWIDYCCIDQTTKEKAIPLLPLWVSCCERFLRVDTQDYNDRAWCRVEALLSYIFSFADHQVIITPEFSNNWPQKGEKTELVLQNPMFGQLTCEEDKEFIQSLVDITRQSHTSNSVRKSVEFGKTRVKCYNLNIKSSSGI